MHIETWANEWLKAEYVQAPYVYYREGSRMKKMTIRKWEELTRTSRNNGYWTLESLDAWYQVATLDPEMLPEGYCIHLDTPDGVYMIAEVIDEDGKHTWCRNDSMRFVQFLSVEDAQEFIQDTNPAQEEHGFEVIVVDDCETHVVAYVSHGVWIH